MRLLGQLSFRWRVAFQPYPIQIQPGVQRDGTELDASTFTDARWCRFQRSRPRKMGGYKTVSQNLTAISRALHSQTQSGFAYIHSGFAAGLEVVTVDVNGFASLPSARTPGGFASNVNNVWQFDSFYDPTSGKQQILAFVVPALADIGYGTAQGVLYAGDVYATTALTSVPGLFAQSTGGVMVIPPYTVVYGSNGFVQWSVPLKPLDFTNTGSGAANVTKQKIVRGLPVRGGGGFSPGALLWTLDAVVRMYFIGGSPIFAFDQVAGKSSILSHNSVVDVDGIYYWIGTDRFLRYAGYIQEVPNDRNINFFFDNLNRQYAQKAFAFKNARWGEVWFCAPLFNATEPNWAVIYNYRENIWYDTQLPNSGRSFGIPNDLQPGMLMSGIDLFATTYRLWNHETGHDEIDGARINALPSSFTTNVISPATFQQSIDRGLHIDTLETDFIQTGAMSVQVFTRATSRGPYTAQPLVNFGAAATTTYDQQIPLRATGKQMKFQFISNVAGGDYQAGRIFAYVEMDQARRTQ